MITTRMRNRMIETKKKIFFKHIESPSFWVSLRKPFYSSQFEPVYNLKKKKVFPGGKIEMEKFSPRR